MFVDLVRDQILQSARSEGMEVLADCFMPDHLHMLIGGLTESADAIRFVHQAKQRSAFTFSSAARQKLWQPSYYDRILRDEESTLSVIRYLFENPVRAGVARTPAEYPYVKCTQFTIDQVLEAICWQP